MEFAAGFGTSRSGTRRVSCLGGESLDNPVPLGSFAVVQPVVQAIGPLLPELDLLRQKAKPAPALGHRQLALAVARRELSDAALELLAARDDLALRRGQRAELTATRAR